MIIYKNASEIQKMKEAGKILGELLQFLEQKAQVGTTTKQLNDLAINFIKRAGGTPGFLNYGGFPGAICTSVDNQVVHGIPSEKVVLKDGMLVSIDAGVVYKGWQSDAARTFMIGNVSDENKKLVEITKESFFKGVEQFNVGSRLGDIGSAIQKHAESNGYGVVRALVGHGIGRDLHEDPQVPNYGRDGRGLKLEQGLVLAIEPMINLGTHKVKTLSDGWTVITADGKPSAHYENTVALTDHGVEILTL